MFTIFKKLFNKFPKKYLLLIIATLVSLSALESPTHPAEKIRFNYSLLGFKVEIADLELFAEEGIVTNRLNFYLKRISPEQRAKFQEFLQQSYEIDPVLVYRFSRTSVGIKLLERLGDIIQVPHNINGFYGLRSAVVQTAASPEGVDFVNFLQHFPTDIQLNLEELLKLVKQISRSEKNTKEFINQLSSEEQNLGNKNNSKQKIDLSVLGEFKVTKETLEFRDRKRKRTLITDLYLPQTTVKNVPLIVVSNGLGARRRRFDELANHLASYGFAVAIPEHPGSNHKRQQEFIQGLHKENFDASDFVDRPLDISFILDRLTILNQDKLNNQLDTNNVGIFGYSIGGTTALSLAGAEIDFEKLERDCDRTLDLTNISILYQCRVLELSKPQQSLKDNRIKSAFLFVPFGNSLFSETELAKVKIPMLWQVVDKDFLTSLTKEQLPAFNALINSDRFLILSENLPHSTATLSKQRSAAQQNESRIARKYQNILSLVFFKKYLTDDSQYSNYLDRNLVKEITEAPYKLHLVEETAKANE